MKLYYFNPNDYGEEYFVMAQSKEVALECLKDWLKKKADDSEEQFRHLYQDDVDEWKDATPNDLPKKYSLDEHQENEIVQTEIS